jgi:hypothetical protein
MGVAPSRGIDDVRDPATAWPGSVAAGSGLAFEHPLLLDP